LISAFQIKLMVCIKYRKPRYYGIPDRKLTARIRPLPNAGERPLMLKADIQVWPVVCTLSTYFNALRNRMLKAA